MNKNIVVIVSLLSVFFIATNAEAAKLELKWQHPEKYRDIKAGDNYSRKAFQNSVFKALEKHLTKLASKLPETQTLKINVNDVDLAGDVNLRHGGIRRIRVIEDIFFPRIKFNYQLVDANNKVLKEDEVNLKDMGFMLTGSLRYQNDSFGYEKRMLDKWFKETFSV